MVKKPRKGLCRKVHIRLSEEDVGYINFLMKKKGWDRSKAIRHMVREVGKALMEGRAYGLKFYEDDAETKVVKVPQGTQRVILEFEE